MGVVVDKVVKEGGGENRSLGDPGVDRAVGGEGTVVDASGCPAFEVAGQPADEMWVKGGAGYL